MGLIELSDSIPTDFFLGQNLKIWTICNGIGLDKLIGLERPKTIWEGFYCIPKRNSFGWLTVSEFFLERIV